LDHNNLQLSGAKDMTGTVETSRKILVKEDELLGINALVGR